MAPARMQPLPICSSWHTGRKQLSSERRLLQTAPARLDWRALGKVSPVRRQGYCGSCWAFAGISTVESYMMIYKGVASIDLSEQALVSSCAAVPAAGQGAGAGAGAGQPVWAASLLAAGHVGRAELFVMRCAVLCCVVRCCAL